MGKGESVLRVRYQETDQMGVVYHANYIVWMEVGRGDYFRKLGLSYSAFEKENIFLPVVSVSCNYKSPARYEDVIKIITKIDLIKEVKIGFSYQIYHENERLLAEGKSEHAFVNDLGRPVSLKKYNPSFWTRLMDAVQREGGD